MYFYRYYISSCSPFQNPSFFLFKNNFTFDEFLSSGSKILKLVTNLSMGDLKKIMPIPTIDGLKCVDVYNRKNIRRVAYKYNETRILNCKISNKIFA